MLNFDLKSKKKHTLNKYWIMSLKIRIDQDIKEAMKNKDSDRLRALRAIKSMILLAETEKGASDELSEDAEMKLLTKAAKQRKESLDLYVSQKREDLATKEQQELDVIQGYLPEQLTEEELEKLLSKIISDMGASGLPDMGKVMGAATKELAGKADGKLISQIVRSLLS